MKIIWEVEYPPGTLTFKNKDDIDGWIFYCGRHYVESGYYIMFRRIINYVEN